MSGLLGSVSPLTALSPDDDVDARNADATTAPLRPRPSPSNPFAPTTPASRPTMQQSAVPISRPPRHPSRSPHHLTVPSHNPTQADSWIKRENLSGMPPWPPTLRLSLNMGNWLEWSRRLIHGLSICQIDDYPLGKLPCPNPNIDPAGHHAWVGNDRMILNFMRSQIYASEEREIAECDTSAEAYHILQARHEKRSGMTQLQLIQRLGQIWFNDDPQNFETQLAHWRDLVYQIDNIGRIDASRLGLLYLFQNLKVSHPTVHDALAPAIMDGSMTEEMFVLRMRYYFEMRAAQAAQTYIGGQPGLDVALPAFTPRVVVCNNCKKGGHTFEFCVAPGGKLAGLSTYEAIMRQHASRDNRPRRDAPPGNNPSSMVINGRRYRADTSPPTGNAPTMVINGQRYQLDDNPQPEPPPSAHIAIEPPFFAADQAEYNDWNNDVPDPHAVETNTALIASASVDFSHTAALFAQTPEPSFYLDSGATAHISCMISDFQMLNSIPPRRISGVGGSMVLAVGSGTMTITLPSTDKRLTLDNACGLCPSAS
ncbi:hypothetical protein BJV78DRAFT_1153128 [Lactifluus subvellereus]|nr:hypothetical protein BJV78DRAFT_1153128 [Lactifluus subvellereus]